MFPLRENSETVGRPERHPSFAGTVASMKRSTGSTTLITLGLIAMVVGLIWVGQGIGLIPGSFMTGDTKWLVIGLIVAVVGIIVLVLGLRRPKVGPRE